MHARRLRRQVHGALERRGRLVEVAPLLLDHAQHPVGRREVRIELDRVVALLERRLEVAAVEMHHGEVARDDRRHRIERLRDAASRRAPRRAGRAAPGTTSRTSDARSRSADRARSRAGTRARRRPSPSPASPCTCASDVCASAELSSSITAVAALRRRLRPDLGRAEHAVVRRAGRRRRPGRCAPARTARPRPAPSRRSRAPCAALLRCAD